MKKTLGTLAGITLIALSSNAFADEASDIGKKIYDRAFGGRGCGTCHDIASNPQLFELIKSGNLDRAKLETTLREGKGAMPKLIDDIMSQPAVKKAGYGETQALDALWTYLSTK